MAKSLPPVLEETSHMMEDAGNPGESNGFNALNSQLKNYRREPGVSVSASPPLHSKLGKIRLDKTKAKQTDKAGNTSFT